jgi:hypothetical protein
MIKSTSGGNFGFHFILLATGFLVLIPFKSEGQLGRYWDQSINSEAALLSGAVVAGEGGIAAIYYNPATITQMTKSNLSLSANLLSLYYLKAEDALGKDFPADRVQFNVYPRIITLTLNPKKSPKMTLEMAYFTKANEYIQINKGISFTDDIIEANPGDEIYTGEYYLRSKIQENYGGAGLGYKVNKSLSVGLSAFITYKDDQYYNLVTADAVTPPGPLPGPSGQVISGSRFHLKYNEFDVRLLTKVGLRYRKDLWAFGMNLNIPSLKIFGNGTVVKNYEYSNIHINAGDTEGSDLYYGARQRKCPSNFKDPFSVAAGINFYSPSEKTILLFTAEYFSGVKEYNYIEAHEGNGEDDYNISPFKPENWLSFRKTHDPVFNAGMAFKKYLNDNLVLSGGFRTDFHYSRSQSPTSGFEENTVATYSFDVYHLNTGVGYNFKRGSIILGMQFSYGQNKNQKQLVNLTYPVEYINEFNMPLTGIRTDEVQVKYFDVTAYFGFLFNFFKAE